MSHATVETARPARLTRRSEFQAAAGDGRRFRSSALTVQVRERRPDEAPGAGLRVGLTASRHTGSATERNRIRRRLRAAAAAAYGSDARPLDIVAVARREALTEAFATLIDSLRRAPAEARAQGQKGARRKGAAPRQPTGPNAPKRDETNTA